MPALARRALLGVIFGLAGCAAAEGPPLTSDGEEAVRRVQAWFDGLVSLHARFIETSSERGTEQGTVVFAPGGRLRLDYAPGDRVVLVATGGRITAFERASGATTRMPARATPLGLLLGPAVRLRGDGIAVVQAITDAGSVQVSIAPAADRGAGLLTLVFGTRADGTLVLSSLQAVDGERHRTNFRFYDVSTGGTVPPTLFDPARSLS